MKVLLGSLGLVLTILTSIWLTIDIMTKLESYKHQQQQLAMEKLFESN